MQRWSVRGRRATESRARATGRTAGVLSTDDDDPIDRTAEQIADRRIGRPAQGVEFCGRLTCEFGDEHRGLRAEGDTMQWHRPTLAPTRWRQAIA